MQKNKRITAKIMDGNTIVMTIDQNLVSVEFGALDRGSLTGVADWGIYVNRGSLSFIDNSGFFNNQTINSPKIVHYIVKFYLSYGSQEYLIATFKIASASLKEDEREVTLQCVSKLEDLRKLRQARIFFPFKNSSIDSLLEFDDEYSEGILAYFANDRLQIYELAKGDDTTNLEKTVIYCPYFPIDSLWSNLTKICQASMSRIIENEEGTAVITGSYPQKKPILIQPKNIVSIPNSQFVRAANVSIAITDREKRTAATTDQKATLDDVYVEFTVNYDEKGNFVSLSGGQVSEGYEGAPNAYVVIWTNKQTPYKIWGDINRYKINTIVTGTWTGKLSAIITVPYSSVNPADRYTARVDPNDPSLINITTPPIKIYGTTDDADSVEVRMQSLKLKFQADHFKDFETQTQTRIIDENQDIFEIPSNDLVQGKSYILENDGSEVFLADYILQEVSRRYGNGIECFEIECLFNDYYYEDGTKAFDGENLSRHFKKYDVIIPYVKKQGRIVPLRTNPDGTPKKFRIIGISYLYDGLLRQKLQIQEERYDID